MDIAVIGTSKKENERRVPIHPDQISWIRGKVCPDAHVSGKMETAKPSGPQSKLVQSFSV